MLMRTQILRAIPLNAPTHILSYLYNMKICAHYPIDLNRFSHRSEALHSASTLTQRTHQEILRTRDRIEERVAMNIVKEKVGGEFLDWRDKLVQCRKCRTEFMVDFIEMYGKGDVVLVTKWKDLGGERVGLKEEEYSEGEVFLEFEPGSIFEGFEGFEGENSTFDARKLVTEKEMQVLLTRSTGAQCEGK